jgi:hypothetical protein
MLILKPTRLECSFTAAMRLMATGGKPVFPLMEHVLVNRAQGLQHGRAADFDSEFSKFTYKNLKNSQPMDMMLWNTQFKSEEG